MNTVEALQRFEETANYYIRELDNFSMEQLHRQPSKDEWSLGQMYLHLINAALYMQMRNIDQCMMQSEDGTASSAVKTKEGEAIFEQGGFPPIRIQVPPSPQYTPQQPESKEQLTQGLNAVIRRMKEIEPTLEQAPKHTTVSHPRFGALNAKEWFLLIEMHYRHHLRQMDRLREGLESSV
ncbi:DinB family protein [Paenibacillus caui]|uniref:DinB family protein n=1 Tax=Paenibacillus caui TaxID=2873927 RepID=UPI001CA8FD0D|nr:DinB family protein [Paenibacillus caui]